MLVYDIAKGTSFQNLEKWIRELREHTEEHLAVMLVGNKSDLKHLRMIEPKRGRQFAVEHGMMFYETSALDSTNVNEAFEKLFEKIYETVIKRESDKENKNVTKPETERNGTATVSVKSQENVPLHEKQRMNKTPCCGTA